MHTLFLAPSGFGGGLNSISLGLIRALENAGLKVGFFKPIAQPFPLDQGLERSCILVERTLNQTSPEPLPLEQVERQLADGELDLLLEDVVSRYQQVAAGKDVVIVEGMVPTREFNHTSRINSHLAKSLDAEVILIAAQGKDTLKRMAERLEIQAQLFGGTKDPKVLGVILNKIKSEDGLPAFIERLKAQLPILGTGDFQLLGAIPFAEELNALRTRDIAQLLEAKMLNEGEAEQRRVKKILLCARAVPNTVPLLQPGVLVVTPGDRDDIILAACMASLNGVKLAGLLLCSDFQPDPRIMELCKAALDGGLPIMTVQTASYDTATNLFGLNKETPADDIERATRVTDYIAQHLQPEFLHSRLSTPRGELRLSPPAFRYQLVKRAQDAN
nr:AAA family ATPase [Pseudomonas sp.]